MGKYRKLAMFSISLDAITTEWEPVRQREINCLVEVKLKKQSKKSSIIDKQNAYPVVEASMICFRKCNNKLPRSLVASIHLHSSLLKPFRIHEGDQLEKKVWLRFKKIRRFTLDCSFKLICICARYAIPCLGLSPVHYRTLVKHKTNICMTDYN
jgi:hypothetical protein